MEPIIEKTEKINILDELDLIKKEQGELNILASQLLKVGCNLAENNITLKKRIAVLEKLVAPALAFSIVSIILALTTIIMVTINL